MSKRNKNNGEEHFFIKEEKWASKYNREEENYIDGTRTKGGKPNMVVKELKGWIEWRWKEKYNNKHVKYSNQNYDWQGLQNLMIDLFFVFVSLIIYKQY